MISDSEVAPGGPREETLEQAGAAVLAEVGAEASPENRIEAVPEPGPDFEKMVRAYLPKPFVIAAYLLDGDAENSKILLSDKQIEFLVPQGALSLEELWPFLPEFFKNSRFKHTYAFLLSFGLIAGENCIRIYKTAREKLQAEAEQKPSTSTVVSAA